MAADEAATDEATEEVTEEAVETDELREGLVVALTEHLGDAVLDTHIRPGDDLWVRVDRAAWQETGRVARDRLGCRYFTFLSAIDWLPSPFGRYHEAEVTAAAEQAAASAEGDGGAPAIEQGYAGGDTRFQILARVANLRDHYGITLKADLPDDDLRIDTWVHNYYGANWHERETWEMFGITFTGHPFLTHIYLPGEFEGYPLRKDFPLLARLVKPWPGIVDVEEMPEVPDENPPGENPPGEGEDSGGEDSEGEQAGGEQ